MSSVIDALEAAALDVAAARRRRDDLVVDSVEAGMTVLEVARLVALSRATVERILRRARACDACAGDGYLLEQSYGLAPVPAGWSPVQRCDNCRAFESDEAAAAQAAFDRGWHLAYFAGPPGDWAVGPLERIPDRVVRFAPLCRSI